MYQSGMAAPWLACTLALDFVVTVYSGTAEVGLEGRGGIVGEESATWEPQRDCPNLYKSGRVIPVFRSVHQLLPYSVDAGGLSRSISASMEPWEDKPLAIQGVVHSNRDCIAS